MNKKEVAKIKPGTWIEIKWNDAPNSVALLIGRDGLGVSGDMSLECAHFDAKGKMSVHSRVVHSQVVRVIGQIQVPRHQQLRSSHEQG